MKSRISRAVCFITVLCFLVISVPFVTRPITAKANSNLLLSYDFDETSGSTAMDTSGNHFDGTLSKGAAFDSDGKDGGCVSFNGTNGYVTIPNGILKDCHNITVSADVYINTATTNTWVFGLGPDSGKYIFVNSKNSSGYTYGALTTYGTAGYGYKGEKGVKNLAFLPKKTWTNVTLTISTDTHSERLYINGSLVQSNNDIDIDPASIYDASKSFSGYIGKSLYSADPYLNAKIDNFKIYNTALSTSEISSNSLLLQYDFSNVTQTNVLDLSGHGFDGTLSSDDCVSSGTLNLDGTNYLTIPNGVLKGIHNLTITADVYVTNPATNAWIFTLGKDSGNYLFVNSQNFAGKTYGGITLNQSSGNGYKAEQGVSTTSALTSGSFVHLAYVVSGDAQLEQLYINGSLVSSMSKITTDPSNLYDASASFSGYIGKSFYDNDPNFQGKIDNFCIYGSALNVFDLQKIAGTSNSTQLQNGALWLDTSGNPIDAYGGCILKVDTTYYWYGNSGVYVNCYTSNDLVHWTFSNAILGPNSIDTGGAVATDLTTPCVVERPKVIFNSKTNQYVLWFHYDAPNYGLGKVGIATCSTPNGDFTYHERINPGGLDSRDMTLFQDNDGSAYLISATVTNGRLSLFQLSDDYLSCTFLYNIYGGATVGGTYAGREAPAIVNDNGTYYLITSACAGWYPNQAKYSICTTTLKNSSATSWSAMQSIGNSSAFYSQSTWILPMQANGKTSYMLMSDRNRIPNTGDQNSYFVWFPLTIQNQVPSFDYASTIALDANAGTITNIYAGSNVALGKTASASSAISSNPASYANDGNYSSQWLATSASYPSTWSVDLGANYALNDIQLSWLLYNGSEALEYYTIYTSTDGTNYSVLLDNTNGTTYGFNDDFLGGKVARYLKIQINRCAPQNNPSNSWYTPTLFEVKIYGNSV